MLLWCQQAHAFVRFPPVQAGRTARPEASRATTRLSYAPESVQDVWDNHFAAFGGKDLEKIMLDYDDNSVITTYDQTSGKKEVFKGEEGARTLFTGLFEAMSDQSDLAAPMIDVDEASKLIFLIWRCPASGFLDATDTFLINGETSKIYRQNVAFKTG
eukprot:g6287.t1